jgi:hypothetical protein
MTIERSPQKITPMSQSLGVPDEVLHNSTPNQPTVKTMPVAPTSRLDSAWIERMLIGAKRMHEDEQYRLEIARQLR